MKLSAPSTALLRRVSSRCTAAGTAPSTRRPPPLRSASTAPSRPPAALRAVPPARQQRHQAYSSSSSSASAKPTTVEDLNPAPHTHYSLFPQTLPAGPPPAGAFSIDLSALRKEFLQLQGRAHPDRHAGASKARAEAASSAINEAYKTLQDPLRRARYLLQLRGVDVEDDGGKLGGDGAPGGDMELLVEVMEAREAVEEAGSEAEVEVLREENEERIARSVGVLEEAFAEGDVGGAGREAVRLGYWRNIAESLREWTGRGEGHVLQH